MKGYVFLTDEAIDLEKDLIYWVQLALEFNPQAKASKKRKEIKKTDSIKEIGFFAGVT